jgi:LmbE family N-acetylglucosaminyl deacetylase
MIPAFPVCRRLGTFVLGAVFFAGAALATDTIPATPAAIQQELRSFGAVGSVLHIAAHPDDENTQLITYFARGRGYRTAYLSLTRGDGGQNEIGPEFDEKLGVARTQELLAARRLDGGRQYFTRAIDFGFSKNAEETLQFWDRDQVLADVVRVIRTFRPDVIVTRFSPGSSGSTHGHHTASGILGVEAFKLAGDPKAYPEQLAQGLTVWQPKRVVLNGGGPGRGGEGATGATVRGDIGGNDPVTGESFAAIAGRSRAMHITQGFGNAGGRGGAGGPNVQSFTVLGGEPAEKDIFDGVDTTWARYPGGAEIGRLADEAIAQFKTDDPAASVPAILAIRKRLIALGAREASADSSFVQKLPRTPADELKPSEVPVLSDKLAQLTRILQACLGLKIQTITSIAEATPGETIKLRLNATASSNIPVKWTGYNTGAEMGEWKTPRQLKPNQTETVEDTLFLPADTPVTQPYWLREEGAAGIFRVDDPTLIGQPENPPVVLTGYWFEVAGEGFEIVDSPVQVTSDAKGEHTRKLDVIPPVSLRFTSIVSLFTLGATRNVTVEVLSSRAGTAGELKLEVPAGWKASPAAQSFKIAGVGEKARFTFSVTAPAAAASARMNAVAVVNGQRYSNQRIEINYAHIPLQLLQPPARARLVSASYAIKGTKVGYLPGAGDDVASALEQLGYRVTTLTGADLTPEKLRGLDAVVIGVRAFNERKDLAANLPGLFAYVENGGTVIAQYNRQGNLPPLGPYALSIAGSAPALRVTDEKSPVTFLAPDHPALNVPNKITAADFEGWVQERGAYFPSTWDEHFTSVLAINDPGEAPLKSSVLVAKYGKGYYVYTGLAFFRQLPAGVPGAYRLFANLVSLGKE